MRHLIPIALALSLAACQSDQELRHTSTLQAVTNGVVLSDDGSEGFAAMQGTTCTIHTGWGCPTSDTNLPTYEERIVDHYRGETLGASPAGVHRIVNREWLEVEDIEIDDVVAARLTDEGAVFIRGDVDNCSVQWEDGTAVVAPSAACEMGGKVSVDREGGSIIVATSDGIITLNRDSSEAITERGDLVAWDRVTRLIYTADIGATTLRALTRRGALVWEVETLGAIRSLTALGRRGEVLVLVQNAEQMGTAERHDGETGKLLGTSTLPDAEGELSSSDNGQGIAVEREDEVHFYSLELSDDEPVVTDSPNCPNLDGVTTD
jgi:hypothetical protein